MANSMTSDTWSVIAETSHGQRLTAELQPGKNLFVGASDHCGLKLHGDGVSSLHCLIMLEGETVAIQDWASKAGTLVNGEAINVRTDLAAGDEVRIAEYCIRVEPRSARNGLPSAMPSVMEQVEVPSPVTQATDTDPAVEPECQSPVAVPQDPIAVEPILPTPDPWADEDDSSFGFDDDRFAGDSFDQETVQLLQAEIEDLQAALAQRDEQIDSLLAHAGANDPSSSPNELEQPTEAMLQRLQDLLDEAECHDERVSLLEELLQRAEEANQAEQEERAQLESWVGDIERRIGEREEEWKAESDALRRQIQQAREERDRVQHQLRDAASHGSAPAAYQETLERLQQQNSLLQQERDAAAKEIASLQQRLERAESHAEEAVRDERAEIARERAELSRMRHELQSQVSHAEGLPQAKEQPDREFADRLKTLREHLKEIHQEEKAEREQRESALSSRISRLWKRLEY